MRVRVDATVSPGRLAAVGLLDRVQEESGPHRPWRLWLLTLWVSWIGACGDEPVARHRPNASISVERIVLDDFTKPIAFGELEEPADQIIGNVTDGVVGPEGRIVLADFMQRAVRAYDRRGRLLGVFGRTGQGPGEYLAPTSVAVDPRTLEVAVNDLGNNRVSRYDLTTRRYVGVHSWSTTSIITHSAVIAPAGGILLLGTAKDPTARPSYQAVLLRGSEVSKEIRLVPLPDALLGKPLAMNLVHAIGDRYDPFFFLGLNASAVIYRADTLGTVLDSLPLPPSVFSDVPLPDTGVADTRKVQELMRSTPWLWSITALSESDLLLEIGVFADSADAWLQSHALLRWTDSVRIWTSSPCDCRLIGHVGDTLLFVRGGAPDPYRLEWRVVQWPQPSH